MSVEGDGVSDLDIRSLADNGTEIGSNCDVPRGGVGKIGEPPLGSVVPEVKMNGEVIGMENGEDLNPSSERSPVTKGKCLRKWRRLKRETSKSSTNEIEVSSTRVHKRGNADEEPSKARNVEEPPKIDNVDIESSVASVNVENSLNSITGPQSEPPVASLLDLQLAELVFGVGFSVGADSDNSEDRSSKSSTAASAPRHKHEGFGFGRERTRVKNYSGKGSSQQRGARGKGESDISKKIKEDHADDIKIENSRSSIESDLRSTNAFPGTSSNGRREQSRTYDDENCDEAQVTEAHKIVYNQENGGKDKESSWGNFYDDEGSKEDRREEDEMFHSQSDEDIFNDSLTLLQEAQETLEKEIEKFVEIGKMPSLVLDYSSSQSYSQKAEESDHHPKSKLYRKVVQLEKELEHTSRTSKARELKVLELEQVQQFHPMNPKSHENGSLELELEDLIQKKLETEIECLTLRSARKAWKLTVDNNFALLEEQKSLLEDYDRLVTRLNDAEDRVVALKSRADEVEASCEELVGRDGVLVLQNGVCKVSSCFFLQLVMFCVAVWVFLRQLVLPQSSSLVPT